LKSRTLWLLAFCALVLVGCNNSTPTATQTTDGAKTDKDAAEKDKQAGSRGKRMERRPEPPSKDAVAKAIQEVERLKGKVEYDTESPEKPVIRVEFHSVPIKDDDLAPLKAFIHLHILELEYTEVTGPGLKVLENFPDLQKLLLIGSPVGDPALVYLKRLPKLHTLSLSRTHITDAGLANLEGEEAHVVAESAFVRDAS
jgi:hypothetical protein